MFRVGVLWGAGLLLSGAAFNSALADVIILRNGNRLQGRVASQTRTALWLRTESRVQVIQKRDIVRIQYGTDDTTLPADVERARRRRLEKAEAERKQREEARRKALEQAENRRRAEERARALAEAHKKTDEKKREVEANRFFNRPHVRSALVPGWGQYSEGSKTRGLAFGIGVGAGFLLTYRYDQMYRAAQAEYLRAAENFIFLSPFVLSFSGVFGVGVTDLAPLGFVTLRDTRDAGARRARFSRRARILGTLTLFGYGANVVDAYFLRSAGRRVTLRSDEDGFRISVEFALSEGSSW